MNSSKLNTTMISNGLLKEAEQIGIAKHLQKKRRCCTITIFITGAICLVFGILTFRYPIQRILMNERLKLTPGLPPYQWWLKPPPEVRLRVFIFTVENPEEFLNGTEKLKLKEFGPIIYRENLHHKDIVFHDNNSTLTYTGVREAEFIEEANIPGILNKTILVPNLANLGIASFLHDASFFTKIGINVLMRSYDKSPFVNITVYNYLWNNTSPVLEAAKKIVPFMVPIENLGVLYNLYNDFTDRLNVNIGKKHGDNQFFLINTNNDRTTVPGFKLEKGDCNASLINSTEGVVYPQGLTKNSTLVYWRKSICRPAFLNFEKTIKINNIEAYKYTLRKDVYDRSENSTADCYKGFDEDKPLPDGISDVSKCYFDLPIAASNPHFLHRQGKWTEKIIGLNASVENHESYIMVEPITGVPVNQCARSQSNLVIKKLNGFPTDIQKFSEMIVPMFWAEYHQSSLTSLITTLVTFMANIMPTLQHFITAILLIVGAGLTALGIIQTLATRGYSLISHSQEKQVFIGRRQPKIYENENILKNRLLSAANV